MENSIGSRSASLAWKLALLLPLAPAVVLQLISQRQTDLRAGVKISGSAQEFDRACILSRFLKNDKFCFCDRHALRFEQ